MKIKGRIIEFRKQLVSGELPERSPQTALAVSWALNFLLGLIMASATIMKNRGPFGVAVTAQSGAGISGLCCALGASVGYLMSFGFERGIKYVAAVVLVYSVGYVFQETRVYKTRWFMPVMSALFMLLTGILGFADDGSTPIVLPMITETILAAGCTYFFADALSTRERDSESAELRRGIALIILCSCLLMAVSRMEIFGVVSVGRLICMLIVMTAAFKGGALSGAAAGAALGLAMDINSGSAVFYSMAYSFSGLISGVFSRHGKTAFTVSYIFANTVCVLWSWGKGEYYTALYETFAATVIFLLLPNRVLGYVGSFLQPARVTAGESGLRRYTAKRLRKMSEAFTDLYETVDKAAAVQDTDENISRVFDRAADTVCKKCKNKSLCWNQEYMDTLAAFNDVTPIINSRGSIAKGDLAGHFIERCLKPDELVSAVNAELRARMYRLEFRARLSENRSAAYSQYFDLAHILKDVSDELQNSYGPDLLAQRRLVRFLNGIDVEADVSVFRDRSGRLRIIIESARLGAVTREAGYLDRLSGVVGVRLCRPIADEGEGRLTLLEAEPLAVTVGIASMKKKGENVSGDRGTYFKTEQGVLCIILSDGMGSGEDAARESVSVVRILESFLRSGVEPASAMKLLNSMMLLKNGDGWGFATVDLMCIDLFTGETGFYKYGAAPSYIRSGKAVRRVRSDSLAAGLSAGDGSSPDVVRMRLKPGSVAIVASDGVLAESNDSWIRSLLASWEGGDTRELARETLKNALSRYGSSDDMTVLAVRVDSRQ